MPVTPVYIEELIGIFQKKDLDGGDVKYRTERTYRFLKIVRKYGKEFF